MNITAAGNVNDFNTSYVAVQRQVVDLRVQKFYYFNTSYVAVQLQTKELEEFIIKISIHLMLRFNFFVKKVIGLFGGFQYILCCGSTVLDCLNAYLFYYFNTSYVAVQLIK